MNFITSLTSLLGLGLLAAAPAQISKTPILPLPLKTIYQFPTDTWLESIDARSNGNLLLSDATTAELWSLDPSTSSPKPKLVYTFPSVSGVLGLTEVTPDVFTIIAGNLTSTEYGVPKSFSIWVSIPAGSQCLTRRETMKFSI